MKGYKKTATDTADCGCVGFTSHWILWVFSYYIMHDNTKDNLKKGSDSILRRVPRCGLWTQEVTSTGSVEACTDSHRDIQAQTGRKHSTVQSLMAYRHGCVILDALQTQTTLTARLNNSLSKFIRKETCPCVGQRGGKAALLPARHRLYPRQTYRTPACTSSALSVIIKTALRLLIWKCIKLKLKHLCKSVQMIPGKWATFIIRPIIQQSVMILA